MGGAVLAPLFERAEVAQRWDLTKLQARIARYAQGQQSKVRGRFVHLDPTSTWLAMVSRDRDLFRSLRRWASSSASFKRSKSSSEQDRASSVGSSEALEASGGAVVCAGIREQVLQYLAPAVGAAAMVGWRCDSAPG